MTYQKPELFLVGAAQGLVQGGLFGVFTDHGSRCPGPTSRNDVDC
jgi:hypothetical protein